MTPTEHRLVMTMLMKQAQAINTLVTILKSRGIIEGDDLKAFEVATIFDTPANDDALRQVAEVYGTLAAKMGLDVWSHPE